MARLSAKTSAKVRKDVLAPSDCRGAATTKVEGSATEKTKARTDSYVGTRCQKLLQLCPAGAPSATQISSKGGLGVVLALNACRVLALRSSAALADGIDEVTDGVADTNIP